MIDVDVVSCGVYIWKVEGTSISSISYCTSWLFVKFIR